MKYDAQVDKELIDFKERLEKLTVDEVERETEKAGLRALIASTVFKKRFPREWQIWDDRL
jgi:hypothetical protein